MTTFRTTRGAKLILPEIYIPAGITPRDLRLITIFIDNSLNQSVNVQVEANRINTYEKTVKIGSPIQVMANQQRAISLSAETSGWLPYIIVSVWCSTTPASGTLTIYRLRSKEDEVKLVDALAIRDAAIHNPPSDPAKVLIQEW